MSVVFMGERANCHNALSGAQEINNFLQSAVRAFFRSRRCECDMLIDGINVIRMGIGIGARVGFWHPDAGSV